MSFGGIYDVAEQQQFFGFRCPGIMSKQPGGAEVSSIADLCVGSSKFRLVRSDAKVARQAHAQSGAHCKTIHGGDGDFWDVVEQPRKFVPFAETIDAFLEGTAGILGHVRDVAACAESPACAGDYDRADAGVNAPGAQCGDGTCYEFGIESVQFFGAVESEGGDPLSDLGLDHERKL